MPMQAFSSLVKERKKKVKIIIANVICPSTAVHTNAQHNFKPFVQPPLTTIYSSSSLLWRPPDGFKLKGILHCNDGLKFVSKTPKACFHLTRSLKGKVKLNVSILCQTPSTESIYGIFFPSPSFFWHILNTPFHNSPRGPWDPLTKAIVVPDVVTNRALCHCVGWEHLLPICNEYAEFSASDPNGTTTSWKLWRSAVTAWFPNHFDSLWHVLLILGPRLSLRWNNVTFALCGKVSWIYNKLLKSCAVNHDFNMIL